MLRILRRSLDALYLAGGVLGALFLIAILLLIVAQMVARWTGQVFPGATDYAGYAMAGASFLALAYAMNRGTHIRVNLMLSNLGRWRRHGELWCYGVGALIAAGHVLPQGLMATPVQFARALFGQLPAMVCPFVVPEDLRLRSQLVGPTAADSMSRREILFG